MLRARSIVLPVPRRMETEGGLRTACRNASTSVTALSTASESGVRPPNEPGVSVVGKSFTNQHLRRRGEKSHEERLNVTGKVTRMTSGVRSRVPGIHLNSNA